MEISVGDLHWHAKLKFRGIQAIKIGETLTDGTAQNSDYFAVSSVKGRTDGEIQQRNHTHISYKVMSEFFKYI